MMMFNDNIVKRSYFFNIDQNMNPCILCNHCVETGNKCVTQNEETNRIKSTDQLVEITFRPMFPQ